MISQVDLLSFIFDRSLVEAVQGIAFSVPFHVPFTQFLCISSCFDIFKNCINSYHIDPEQDQTCLRIVSNRIKSIMTCLDMFENHIKSHHKHYDMSGHVCRVISNCIRVFSKNLGSFGSINSIKSFKSLFRVKSLRSICERSWPQFI